MRRKIIGTAAIAMAVLVLLTAARVRVVRTPLPEKPVSATRSFEITDKPIVAAFTLDRILGQLIARSGVTGITPQQMMRQMFDTQNPRPGLADPSGPHCNDTLVGGVPSFNGFPRRCPTSEAKLAATPYLDGEWFTIGIVNRFDLTPPDGSNCGQYRLVIAHREANVQIRLHLIFEAVLPNPNPSAGIAACRPVAQFWTNLSNVDSMSERRARIEQFFFEGLPGFAPVIDPPNFTDAGGIRSMQAQPGNSVEKTRFYQFRLAKECASGDCILRFAPDVLENMPFGLLFDAKNTSAQARAFRAEFLQHVPTLAINDVNLFFMNIPKTYLMVESNPIEDANAHSLTGAFQNSATTAEGTAFGAQIQAELNRIGSSLTIENITTRADHQSCFGCHGFNGAVPLGGGLRLESSPTFFGNQFISDDVFADGEAGPLSRYAVDPIIEKQFVPHRMKIVADFLRDGTPPVHSN